MQRYPYQRLLDQLCREGREPKDILEALVDLGFRRPLLEDVEALIKERAGEPDDELFNSEDLIAAMGIVKDEEASAYVKSAGQLDNDDLLIVLKHKYGLIVTDKALEAFFQAFWDIESMSHMDAVLYFNKSDETEPPRDKVPMREAPDFYAWKGGEKVELSPDELFDELITDGYFKYKQYVGVATPNAQNEARKWGDFLMKAIKENRTFNARMNPGGGEGDVPEKPELQYDDGDDDVPLIDDIEQPPPEENPS